MFKDALRGVADTITSDEFSNLFIVAVITFLFGMATGCVIADDFNQKQCNEMSIIEALKYPYCRTYLENELKQGNDDYGKTK